MVPCGLTGEGEMAIFGPAVTLPTLGHRFLGSWVSPDRPDGYSERGDVGPLGSNLIPAIPIANANLNYRVPRNLKIYSERDRC